VVNPVSIIPSLLYTYILFTYHWCCTIFMPESIILVLHQSHAKKHKWMKDDILVTQITSRTPSILIEVPRGFFFSPSGHPNKLWKLLPNPFKLVIHQSPCSQTLFHV
jgi:hypothetical protein